MSTDAIYVPPQRIGITEIGENDAIRVAATVEAACEVFALHDYVVAELVKHSNVTARLVSTTGPPLALRLRTAPGVDGRTEFAWLDAVRRGTDLAVVEPFAEEFDRTLRMVTGPDGRPVECALFRWAEGRPLAADLTEVNYHALGRMSARLHRFSSTWTPPSGLRPLVWDRTMYYGGTSLVIGDDRYLEVVSRRDAATVHDVVREADRELARLARAADRMFLHGNIEMWNVLTTGPGELRLLDFEDVMVGPPVLDVAVTLFYGRERADHGALVRAYEAGYRTVREWPVRDRRQMDLLVAARAAMLLNHGLQTEADPRSVTERLLPLILAAAA
ncbi:phosphotransferase [Pseudonocardia sp. KRD-184]|uniref:Phosphotransferase n=1 Tax=Pseudonocardia oceani TaxID=2792013 RepID=A0ABS6UJR8_9PSEU|nr:phosphotransferase [Pseudonocardia oceani]MBW0088611.1 phosphotransferase [Pseudonocardia oceani]MBW0095454.1 phosphotransferase [Pseudonocardia oceani]MBW0109051.1 phosphotransferase [Pseudonocardia oceani]MBW0120024.1 phosphotransferase [Pseudonocardia oceani]MBW0132480.1 phosphotransferase [Pseudonocardia oceani]